MEYKDDLIDQSSDEKRRELVNEMVFELITNYSISIVSAFKIASTCINITEEFQKSFDQQMEEVEKVATDVRAVRNSNPKFKDKTPEELKRDEDFRQALKEYMANSPLSQFPFETEAIKALETFKSILPEKYYITNNKLSNEITKDFLNNGEIPLSVIKPNKKGEVLTYNSLTYDNSNISITGRQEFTAYDRTIHNAVCTLYAANNKIITPAMVYRTANGMIESEKVSSQAEEAVTQSLDKSRFLRLKVDYRDEARARSIKDVKKFEIDSYLFPAKVVHIEAGGHEVRAYKILETPVLYEYAQLTKQIISVPISLLDTREATRNTEEMIPIKEYLIRRIEIMKHDKATSNKILYDTVFEESGIAIKHNTERDRYRKYITAVLSLWKTRENYVKNFKEYKEGKSFKGIEIIY